MEGVTLLDLAVDPADGQVHLGEAPRGVVELLAVDANRRADAAAVVRSVGLDELYGLHEHARRAAARVIHATAVGL